MKIGSLFAGIGGLELGLERAGVGQVAWQVELDPFARSVLARHWPDAARYDDIREVDFARIEPVDVICGGFPCQDISNAGLRAGLAGERSGLWGQMLRAIRVVGPRFVVVENVAALVNRGLCAILGDLAESRYDAEWDCLPACAFGAPHERDRVFVLAHAQEAGCSRGATADGLHGQAGARAPGQSLGSGSGVGAPRRSPWWASEPALGRVVDGTSRDVAWGQQLGALGNAVVPQVAEHVGLQLQALIKGAIAPESETPCSL